MGVSLCPVATVYARCIAEVMENKLHGTNCASECSVRNKTVCIKRTGDYCTHTHTCSESMYTLQFQAQ